MKRLSGLFLVLALAIVPAFAGEVGLSWDLSTGATGYRVYVSQTSGSFPAAPAWDGPAPPTSITAPDGCVQSFTVVTAYNTAGESGPSIQLGFTTRPTLGPLGTGPTTWLLEGDGFTPGLELYIFTAAEPTIPLDVPHAVQDCQNLTIPVAGIPDGPEYFKLRLCTNGGTVCAELLLIPDPPGGLAVS